MSLRQPTDKFATGTLPSRSRSLKNGAVLVIICGLVACLWLMALPWLAKQPKMKQRLDFFDARGIDPSAMYYTDLPAMESILANLECRRTPAEENGPDISLVATQK